MSTTPTSLFHGRTLDGTPVEVWTITSGGWLGPAVDEYLITFGRSDYAMKKLPSAAFLAELDELFGITGDHAHAA